MEGGQEDGRRTDRRRRNGWKEGARGREERSAGRRPPLGSAQKRSPRHAEPPHAPERPW
jgi:hypothetical protein